MKRKKATITINPRLLLAIYAVMPLSLVFVGLDSLLFGQNMRQALPADPRVYAWFILLFMVPHILASFFSFADRDYFNHYKKGLLRGSQIAVTLGIFLPALASSTMLPILIFATYMMVHVFMQQSGVSKSLMRNAAPTHIYWQWLGIAIATIIYAYLLLPMPWLKSIISEYDLFIFVALPVFVLYSLLAINIVRQSRTQLGKIYFLGSHCIPILGAFYIVTGYPILALMIPRVIHDLTAYTFYITHDNNRFIGSQSNLLYRATSQLHLPVYVASPLVSVLLAFIISKFNSATLSVVLTCIFFLHYYTESMIWKRDTLHRTQIAFLPFK